MMDRDLRLAAYADGELEPEQASEVERELESDPQARELVRIHRETTALLRAACAPQVYAEATRHRRGMPQPAARRHVPLRSLGMAAALLAGILGAAAIFMDRGATFESVASTTSTQDSGLFDHLLPLFKAKTGIEVKIIAKGTGQALDVARSGGADVVFVHARELEEKFVDEGEGVRRCPVMYNDFVLVGPKSDPAGVRGSADVVAALQAIKTKGAFFVSRGDRSGTHQAELKLWRAAGIDIAAEQKPWYRVTGQGMGNTLNSVVAMNAYTISDRGTWISHRDKGDLVIMVEGDRRLFNQYSVILVNATKHPGVKTEFGLKFIDWLPSPEGQKAIADYKIDSQQLFFPDADVPGA